LLSGASLAADCPQITKAKGKAVKDAINCLIGENAARAQETSSLGAQIQVGGGGFNPSNLQSQIDALNAQIGSANSGLPNLQTQVDALKAQISDGSSFQAAIEQLQADVKALQGIPPVTPIGTFENDFVKAQVVGLTKIISTEDGTSYVNASFQIQNKTASPLYLAYVGGSFSVVDDHGISAGSNECCYAHEVGLPEFGSGSGDFQRSSFSVLAPNGIVSVGILGNTIDKDRTAKLGNRFNLSFTLQRYLEPNLEQGKTDTATLGFAGIVATQ
jgi:hypothetical protein